MDFKLEVVPLPVTDTDRTKAFYVDQVGFNADHDRRVNENLRFVQLTPPGSACSIIFGDGISQSEPGSVKDLMLVVDDIQRAHSELSGRGVEVSAIEQLPWGDFVYFSDPDGNSWSIQDVTRIRAQQ
jgi:predicted enzyme related to lactoylglutathione lyase